ncbi:MAG: threonine/serine dehydratase [Gemmatimonadaceae bacterium]
MLPTPTDVLAAAHRLRAVVDRTPLVHSTSLSAVCGFDVHLKCEFLQRTGSFKLRGAFNALASLPHDVRERGIVASSAGNHGLGVAYAARMFGVLARIFVPATAPDVKRDGILALGAEVDQEQPHYDAAHEAAVEYAATRGMTFVNPCAGETLLAGQGTVALEILEELPNVCAMVAPVGGGGLIGGMAALTRAVAPHVRMVGAQSERTDAMARSMAAGHRVDIDVLPTLADGLAGQIDDTGLAIAQFAIDEMRVVTESEISSAIAWLARAHDARVEGSAACSVASVMTTRFASLPGPVAVVLTGGNIDDRLWREITRAHA